MTDQDKRREDKREYRKRLVAEGKCQRCARPRGDDIEGSTRTLCGACAKRNRDAERKKNGTPLDAPVKPHHETRSRAPKVPRNYGSLTIDDIRRATSALPLRPPGK